jgi:hypothetical protein
MGRHELREDPGNGRSIRVGGDLRISGHGAFVSGGRNRGSRGL